VSADLVVEAELIDPGKPVPALGMLHAIGLMRYRLERVLEGSYVDDELLVGHSGPDLSAPEFQPGARHRLELSREFPEGASVLSVFDTSERPALYCVAFAVI
jgi:hypothetical protein